MGESGRTSCPAEQLILQETPKAYQFAMRLTRNPEESKELVQEASYRVLLNRDSYDATKPGTGWFHVILHNLFIDSRRAVEHRYGVSLNAPSGDGLSYHELIPSNEIGVSERLEREEEWETVRRISRKLQKDLVAVLKLVDMQGLSYDEAARALSIPAGTVRSRLYRARQAFRSLWEKENLAHAV